MTNPVRELPEKQLNQSLQDCFQDSPLSVENIRSWRNQAILELEKLYNSGCDVEPVIKGRSKLVDRLLKGIWQFGWPLKAKAALVAVGGYGRGELHPHSDIDLLILVPKKISTHDEDQLRQFITFLWDIGLEVGHSVRTPSECYKEAKNDITIATNLMEVRFLNGDITLYEEMKRKTSPAVIWKGKSFYQAKMKEMANRHDKFDSTAYALEPNLKEGPGGLRDIHMLGWLAKHHHGVDSLSHLVDEGFISKFEWQELLSGRNKLWEIRFALHKLCGRQEDRLGFDYQKRLANQFGYQDEHDHNLAVEQFMQSYYRAVTHIHRICKMLFQDFEERIMFQSKSKQPKPLDQSFSELNGYIVTNSDDLFEQDPVQILEMFLVLQREESLQGIHASTQRQMYSAIKTRQMRLRKDPRAHSTFLKILKQKEGVYTQLQNMNDYGVLAAYLEDFAPIVGRMQYDLFHIYTVDQHTLFVIRNMRRFGTAKHEKDFPMAAQALQSINRPELLYLAGFFHDIAKGRGGDHSKLGSAMAIDFCAKIGLPDVDGKLVAWLVDSHLLMSVTAQRQDLSDPDVIHSFAEKMGDLAHLNYLYLLTVADIWGTNPTLWNSFRSSLLRDLFQSARSAIRRGLENPINRDERIQTAQRQVEETLLTEGYSLEAIKKGADQYPEQAYIRFSIDQACWHTRLLMDDDHETVISVRYQSDRGTLEASIISTDRRALLMQIVEAFSQLNLKVTDARLLSIGQSRVLDTFVILDDKTPTQARLDEVKNCLEQALSKQMDKVPSERGQRLSLKQKQFGTRIFAKFSHDAVEQGTLLELVFSDQPKALLQVAQVLYEAGMQVIDAKIATFGDRVEDFFILRNPEDEALTDEECDSLAQLLKEKLDFSGEQIQTVRKAQHNISRL